MSPQEWQRAKVVLTPAAGLAGRERVRLVEAEFPDEPTLRLELLSMLETHDKIQRALELTGTVASVSGLTTVQVSRPIEQPTGELLSIGSRYGPYHVVQALGAGGMGQVFLAEDLRLGRRVALKSLAGRWLGSPVARPRLLQEARAVAALSHSNIATLYDVLDNDQHLLLVMEYVEGRTLAALIASGKIPLGHALRLARQIVDAVVYAHDHGIIHCDLKPLNVQISPDGTAKVLDFGLARAKYDASQSELDPQAEQGMLFGTPPYMPPERLLTGVLNASGDVYSLGVTLFEMVTGRRPFEEADFASLTGAILSTGPPAASSLASECPASLDELIARALAKSPRDRYQTARELNRDLHAVLQAIDTATVTVPALASSGLVGKTDESAFRGRIWPASIRSAAVTLGFTLTGFITSVSYSSSLGLKFEDESPIWWPIWGLRAMVLPLAFGVLTWGILTLLNAGWRAMAGGTGVFPRWCAPVTAIARRLSRRLASISAASSGFVLAIAQLAVLVFVFWRFQDFLGAIDSLMTRRSPGSLTILRPSNRDEYLLYREVLSVSLVGFGFAWYSHFKRHGGNPAGAIVLSVLTTVLLVAPYRTVVHGTGERAVYRSQSCYLVGQRAGEATLFCPAKTPWTRVVRTDDPALERSGITESVFAALDEPR